MEFGEKYITENYMTYQVNQHKKTPSKILDYIGQDI